MPQDGSRGWRLFFGAAKPPVNVISPSTSGASDPKARPEKWSFGILNDKETDEVPGSVLLMSKQFKRNEPLGLRNTPARRSASSLPSPYAAEREVNPMRHPSPARHSTDGHSHRPSLARMFSGLSHRSVPEEKKTTDDGKIILEPQPEDTPNDPLNWPSWRRDVALLSLGFYCMVGGGMTPILAAGFNNVADTFNVTVPKVSLTTGFYMAGLGLGSVIASPTAILFGKRPVYLVGAILFIISSVWCALSPNYASLVVARIFQGISLSPVECLPSATIAEIFFLHERAYRLGIYTLLLLGGKNLVPLVSAVIINALNWRWVFWIVGMVGAFGFTLLFFFVPETFWDRTPHAKKRHKQKLNLQSLSHLFHHEHHGHHKKHHEASEERQAEEEKVIQNLSLEGATIANRRQKAVHHVGFKDEDDAGDIEKAAPVDPDTIDMQPPPPVAFPHEEAGTFTPAEHHSGTSTPTSSYLYTYTNELRNAPPKSYMDTLKPWNGHLRHENWLKAAVRPFILFAYPSILWSTLVYSLSVGWLIVLSESISVIYRSKHTYNFTALQAGLVYLSPFIGGVLGTAVAGKVSDVVVRAMSRRNNGIYEPEFRLVMALPILISTVVGLMGFGWSAEERDNFMVPTIFFGVISFGCSLGSTTAITFAVDSYRQYAGEALVTLNFSKNVLHGLVFSLFFTGWLESDGSKDVFLIIGGIQVVCLLTTIPMYLFGKRARMWTVRQNMMERF